VLRTLKNNLLKFPQPVIRQQGLLTVLARRRLYENRNYQPQGVAVRTPFNLEEAEADFGIERVRKPQRRERRTTAVGMTRKKCLLCDKWGYYSEEAARIIIGRMLRNGSLNGPDMYTFRPYECENGWWHTGHDSKARHMIKEKLEMDGLRAKLRADRGCATATAA
jgi:hypothetical protein